MRAPRCLPLGAAWWAGGNCRVSRGALQTCAPSMSAPAAEREWTHVEHSLREGSAGWAAGARCPPCGRGDSMRPGRPGARGHTWNTVAGRGWPHAEHTERVPSGNWILLSGKEGEKSERSTRF